MNANAYLDRLLNMAALADHKASAAVALGTIVGGVALSAGVARMFSQTPFGGHPITLSPIGLYLVAELVVVVGLAGAFCSAAMVIAPRLKPTRTLPDSNPLFFGSAANMSWDAFSASVKAGGDELVWEQCYQVARIVDTKFRWARRGLLFLYLTLVGGLFVAGLLLQP